MGPARFIGVQAPAVEDPTSREQDAACGVLLSVGRLDHGTASDHRPEVGPFGAPSLQGSHVDALERVPGGKDDDALCAVVGGTDLRLHRHEVVEVAGGVSVGGGEGDLEAHRRWQTPGSQRGLVDVPDEGPQECGGRGGGAQEG